MTNALDVVGGRLHQRINSLIGGPIFLEYGDNLTITETITTGEATPLQQMSAAPRCKQCGRYLEDWGCPFHDPNPSDAREHAVTLFRLRGMSPYPDPDDGYPPDLLDDEVEAITRQNQAYGIRRDWNG